MRSLLAAGVILLTLAAPATAQSSLAHRVAMLEKANRAQQLQIGRLGRALEADDNLIDVMYDRIEDLRDTVSCLYVLGVDHSPFVPAGAVDPVLSLTIGQTDTPEFWLVGYDSVCFASGPAAARVHVPGTRPLP